MTVTSRLRALNNTLLIPRDEKEVAMTKGQWVSIRLIALAVLTLAGQVWAQANTSEDLDSQIEALRSDVRTAKTKIVGEAMRFTPKESEAFWPIYKQYEAELSKLNDERVTLIKEYADKFSTMTDSDAKSMSKKAFDYEAQRVELKRRFFDEFN